MAIYARSPVQNYSNWWFWIKKDAEIKHLNNPNAFIECSNTMGDVYGNTNNYNYNRKRKKIVLDDMIADIMTNKKTSDHN